MMEHQQLEYEQTLLIPTMVVHDKKPVFQVTSVIDQVPTTPGSTTPAATAEVRETPKPAQTTE